MARASHISACLTGPLPTLGRPMFRSHRWIIISPPRLHMGSSYPVLPVWNGTWSIAAGMYRNQALLYNNVRPGWDLAYQYDYAATDSQQKTGWVGSWAPIVETFQSPYMNTNAMGALGAQLISADNNGVWGSWAPLSASDAYVRTDNVGFNLVFLDPNYAFVVTS